mgnify:FL=1|tara:strand:+ start:247 stop:714 length:468 start_codon:yes stop_codon:yes gene_type:complete
MKIAFFLIASCMAANAYAASADKAEALYDRMHRLAPSMASHTIIDDALKALSGQPCFNEMSGEIKTMILDYSNPPGAKKLAINSFMSRFTNDDIDAILAFSETQPGKKMFATMPEVAAEASVFAMNHFQANQQEINKRIFDLLERYKGKTCNSPS